jgi:nitrogen fixation protein NifB
MKMMNHCARCRADAAGLLGQDLTESYTLLKEMSELTEVDGSDRPYVAAATNEGLLVNQHMGEALSLYIYKQTPNGFQFVEERMTPKSGLGDKRWLELAKVLSDCRAILVSGVGENPKTILNSCGVKVFEMTGLIDEGLDGVFNKKAIRSIAKADAFKCGSSCKGNAQGCA